VSAASPTMQDPGAGIALTACQALFLSGFHVHSSRLAYLADKIQAAP